MKLTNEEKQRMLEEVLLEDQTIRKVSDKYQVHYQHLFRLVQRAKHHGIESVLHKSQKRTYSVEFKLEVVKHVQNGNSRAKAALIYNIDQQLVRNWCLKYAEKGTKGLSNSRRKMLREDRTEADLPISKKETHTEKDYQKLEKRLRHAEMENEFLKKLDALVRERIERERGK